MYGKYAYLDNYSKKREVRREKAVWLSRKQRGGSLKVGYLHPLTLAYLK